MRISESEGGRNKLLHIGIRADDHRNQITAYVEPPSPWSSDSTTSYTVNWSALGNQDRETTRIFANALLTACEWLDRQEALTPRDPA